MKHESFLEIYSLKCDSWRKILSDKPTGFQNANSVVYLNGVCHWSEKTDDYVNLVSYDLDNEVFFITPLPLEGVLDGSVVNLQVLNGSLAAIFNHKKTMSFHISILGELGVKESWLKLFNVGPLPSIQLPIGAWKKGNIFLRKIDNELAFLDLTTGVIEEIGVKVEHYYSQTVVYKKNLLFLQKKKKEKPSSVLSYR